jgi:type II secretory pathway pseudopilin PulG
MATQFRGALRQRGFTYVGLIVIVAIIGLTAALTVRLGSLLQRRAAELELLEIGASFVTALESYADASEPDQPRSPSSLDELLRDSRFASSRRHLRQLYADPMTGKSEWGIVRARDNARIIGIYSLSNKKPIKLDNFGPGKEKFKNKSSVSEWKFVVQEERLAGVKATLPLIESPADSGPRSTPK